MSNIVKNKKVTDVLFRIKRGLTGYVSYLAACEMNSAFSEYILYEPILRILTARGFSVTCEYPLPEQVKKAVKRRKPRGDKKRIDFSVINNDSSINFAIEVKWAKSKSVDVKRDSHKLKMYLNSVGDSRSFLCIFGRKSHIENIVLKNGGNFSEKGKAVTADMRKTKFACRIFELRDG